MIVPSIYFEKNYCIYKSFLFPDCIINSNRWIARYFVVRRSYFPVRLGRLLHEDVAITAMFVGIERQTPPRLRGSSCSASYRDRTAFYFIILMKICEKNHTPGHHAHKVCQKIVDVICPPRDEILDPFGHHETGTSTNEQE